MIGFGSWKYRTDWPLNYLKTVKEIKVFGIIVMDSYRSMIKKKWDFRFKKFQDVVKSWSSRVLESLSQRVEVLRMFALSRVFDVASILQIRITMVRKFESVIGKFLWNSSGRLLRVSLGEVKNSFEKGGLGLTCIWSMCQSLMLSQLLRLLKSGDSKSVSHVGFWLGEILGDLVLGLDDGEHAGELPEYFDHLADLVVEAKSSDLLNASSWRMLTSKKIYLNYAETFPVPKVEKEAGVSYQADGEDLQVQFFLLLPGILFFCLSTTNCLLKRGFSELE